MRVGDVSREVCGKYGWHVTWEGMSRMGVCEGKMMEEKKYIQYRGRVLEVLLDESSHGGTPMMRMISEREVGIS